MLAIEIEYLSGRVVASDYGDRSLPEWPIHPQRLFSALVATHAECGPSLDTEQALRWLEKQPPPSMRVDLAPGTRQTLSFWVPVNDETIAGKNSNLLHVLERRTKQERFFPSVLPSDPCVTFVWPESTPEPEVLGALGKLLSRLSYVGHSSSLVRACLKSEVPPVTLTPDDSGDYELRVPGPGRFDRLQQVHQLRMADETIQPPIGRVQRYLACDTRAPSGDFVHAYSVAFDDGRRLGLAQTVAATDRLRRALLSKLPDIPPETLSGHQSDGAPSLEPHLAIVPLAFVDERYASGELKGLALLLPKRTDAATWLLLDEALAAIEQLEFGRMGVLRVRRVENARSELQSLRFQRYLGTASTWRTVTPLVLERFPKRNLTIEQIIVAGLMRQGLPAPVRIETQSLPPVSGSELSSRFDAPGHFRGKMRLHVQLHFAQDIRGPLLLGAGRFKGLGLFLPESVR